MKTFCRYYNENVCLSCDLLETDYPSQVKAKEKLLRDLVSSELYLPTVESAQQGFRNKAKFSVTGTVEHPLVGLIGDKDNVDTGKDLSECLLHYPQINALLPDVKLLIKAARLTPYSILEKKGELKGLIAFYSSDTHEIYLRLVLRSKESIDRIKKHLPDLLKAHPELTCVTVNIQPVPHAILEGDEEIFLTESKVIRVKAGNVFLKIHPQAFVQTNQTVAKKLYATAAEWVKEIRVKKFAELFCGQGAFSFYCAPNIEEGIGVEINAEAVATANKTAEENHLPQLRFFAADAAEGKNILGNFNPDVILVNPPRRGLGESIKMLQELSPARILYSSCNVQTLAKDLTELKEYKVVRAQIFDMFPHTSHFETLVELVRTIK